MNPLDLTGAAFVELFIVAWLAAIGVLLAVRGWLTRGSGGPTSAGELAAQLAGDKLPTSVAAYVSGGIECAVEAAVAGLHHQGALHVEAGMLVPDPPEPVLQPDGTYRGMVVAPPPALMPVEAFVMTELDNGPQTVGGLIRRATRLADQLHTQMLTEGLIVPDVARTGIALCGCLLGVTWFTLGLTKVALGAAHDDPAGFLLVLMFLGGYPFFKLSWVVPRMTRKGQEVLRLLRERVGGLVYTAASRPRQLDGRRFALAYVLAGAELVAPVELLELMPSYQRQRAEALRTPRI